MLFISEAANFYHNEEGKTLVDKLNDIFEEYGYYYEGLENIHLLGKEGQEKIAKIMNNFRTKTLSLINGIEVSVKEDYFLLKRFIGDEVEDIDLYQSNVIKYILKDNSWFVLRPSGTEPKLKIYAGVIGSSLEDAQRKVKDLLKTIKSMVEKVG